jgi:hypothetical protein
MEVADDFVDIKAMPRLQLSTDCFFGRHRTSKDGRG